MYDPWIEFALGHLPETVLFVTAVTVVGVELLGRLFRRIVSDVAKALDEQPRS